MIRSTDDNEGFTPPRHVEVFTDFARACGAFLFAMNQKSAISLGTLKTRLKAFVSSQRIEEAVSALVAEHQAIPKKTIELTRKGKERGRKTLGQDAGHGWEESGIAVCPSWRLG